MMMRFAILVSTVLAALSSAPSWGQLRSPVISELAANRYGLTRSWFGQVQLDRTRDRIQSYTLYDSMLFAQTKRGVIHAFDAETGKTLWVNRVGSPDHPTTDVGANATHLAALNGSTLYVFDRKTGKSIWHRRTNGAPGAGPGLSNEYVFIPTTNGIIEAYELEDAQDRNKYFEKEKEPQASQRPRLRKPAWLYNSGGRALVQPFVANESVSWVTDRGLFFVAGADNLSIRFRTEAHDDIVAMASYMKPYFYVGSLDGHLYKIHERSGTIAWRFTAGEPVVERPVSINGLVFFCAQHGGLFCILGDGRVAWKTEFDARRAAADRGEIPADQVEPEPLPVDEGSELWWSPSIARLLAVSPTRVYGLDKSGRMRIVSADSGSPIATMGTEHLTMGVINHVSDRIYLGNEYGFIQCLHEPQLKQPLRYFQNETEEENAAQPALADGQAPDLFGAEGDAGNDAAAGADPFAAGADPFGADADPFGGADPGANPFGAGADPNPFGGGADAGADPFGGGGANDAGADPFGGGGGANDADPFN